MSIWDRGRLRHSVGIETKGGRFTPLIQLKPFQGESPLVSFNRRLGHFDVTEIPPANPGEPLIYVTFHVDAQGELSITARDEGTGRDLPVLRR